MYNPTYVDPMLLSCPPKWATFPWGDPPWCKPPARTDSIRESGGPWTMVPWNTPWYSPQPFYSNLSGHSISRNSETKTNEVTREATTDNKTKLEAKITRSSEGMGGVSLNYDESLTFEVGQIDVEEVKKFMPYSEYITSLLRNHSDEMTDILNHFLTGRTQSARELAVKIGFTEEAFQQQSGGERMWPYIIAVGIMIYAAAATQKPQ